MPRADFLGQQDSNTHPDVNTVLYEAEQNYLARKKRDIISAQEQK